MTEPHEPRWVPDEQMVEAVIHGSSTRSVSDFAAADRAWVVAGLRSRGLTAEDIGDRLQCSVRRVRAILAEPTALLARRYQDESRNFADETALLQSELRQALRDLFTMTADRDRTKIKLDRLLDAHLTGVRSCGRCGTPMDFGNTWTDRNGKNHCRCCHRRRQQDYRDNRKNVTPTGVTPS